VGGEWKEKKSRFGLNLVCVVVVQGLRDSKLKKTHGWGKWCTDDCIEGVAEHGWEREMGGVCCNNDHRRPPGRYEKEDEKPQENNGKSTGKNNPNPKPELSVHNTTDEGRGPRRKNEDKHAVRRPRDE